MASLRITLFFLLFVIGLISAKAIVSPRRIEGSMISSVLSAVKQDDDAAEGDPEASASPDEEDEVCVDAKHLAHYPADLLVHSTPFRSSVFCPVSSSLPCATADHMLRVDGHSISYREYCNVVKCTADVMDVNSVMSHVWKESSHDNGRVLLTMYDARHPESLQRMVHRVTALRRSIVRVLA